ncbi:bifunctional riboflavin kinase/FAD synthetase [Desulfocurvibacter africanus]|uniref:bifunctional riboflavin kinase/FAD synthetase n=1 Tax=Desulfocurvibacter africanus TaxID=873 RepID=UPI002FDAE330
MITVNSIDEISLALEGSCATIGNFDGVHKGHQRLISMTAQRALERGLTSVVVTFEPHPLRFFTGRKSPPSITLLPQKLELIAALGPQVTLVLPFNRELAALEPEAFVRRYLVDGLRVKELFIGYDYAFGKGRLGNYGLLTLLGQEHGFAVEQIDPVIVGEAIVSSTRVRDMVESGRVWEAHDLLGRFYQVRGMVIHGRKRGGDLLGFPTANLEPYDELLPKPGVYAVWVETEYPGELRRGVANIGHNPTFGENALSVEAHILDYKAQLYGREIRIHFVQRIRDERKFSGPQELVARINEDVRLSRQILDLAAARP